MALSDLAVFSEHVYSNFSETLDQQVDLFNAASGGTLVLRSAAHQGDFSETAYWAKLAGLVRRRNAYGSGAVSALDLGHLVASSVKVAAGTPPVNIPPGMMRWIQRSPEEAAAVIGVQLAKDAMADMLNLGIASGVAALGAVAAVVTDVSGGTGDAAKASLANMNTAVSKFGDRAQAIQAWVMHSKPLFDVYGMAIANGAGLFTFGTINIKQDGFGRPWVITDSPSLVQTGTPNKYVSLGLQSGAILVDRNNDFEDNVETSNGDENIQRTYQAEWSYNLGVNGFTWDQANGGKSPNNAALSSSANWDRVATYDKDLAGVLLKSQ